MYLLLVASSYMCFDDGIKYVFVGSDINQIYEQIHNKPYENHPMQLFQFDMTPYPFNSVEGNEIDIPWEKEC